MATLPQLYDALKNADAAGATDDARQLADAIVALKSKAKLAGEKAAEETYDPTSGMSGTEKFFAGMGANFVGTGRGVKQVYAGLFDPSRYGQLQDEEAEARSLNAPLMRTGAGTAGNVAGAVTSSLPLMFLPGGAGLVGSTTIGGYTGLAQPTVKGESRAGNVALGAGLGFAAPLLLRGGNRLYQTGRDLFSPERAAENALAAGAGQGDEVINALRNTSGMETTPGYTPTAAARVASQGVQNPTFAALESRIAQANSPEINRQVYRATQERLTALQDQLTRIDQRMASQRNAMTPQAFETLNQSRQGILNNIAREEQTLASATQRAPAGLPSRVTEPGVELKGQRRVLETEVRKNVTDPAYEAAFKSGGNTFISVKGIEGEVERLMGRPLADIPRGVSKTADKIAELGGRPSTLKQLHDLRIAVNKDLEAANRQGADASLRELGTVKDAIDDAIANSRLSDNAKSLYSTANSLYQREIGDRFRTGLAEQLRRPGSVKEGRILSEDVVSKFLSGERGPGAFSTLFRNDPAAADSMSRGVQAMFRKELEAASPENVAAVAERFMRQHGPALAELEKNGVQARGILARVQQDVSQNARGSAELQTLAKEFGNDNEQVFLRGLMMSPSKMDAAMNRATAEGRTTIASNVVTHVNNLMESNADDALNFVNANRQSLERALRGSGTRISELEDAAKVLKDFRTVQLPEKPIGQSIVDLSAGYTDDQLHSLALVAQDIKDMQTAASQALKGRASPSPNPTRAGQEQGEIGPEHVPGWFSAKIAAIKSVWKSQQQVISDKALARLFYYMYENPDAAISALSRGQARAAGVEGTRKTLNRLGTAAAATTTQTGTRRKNALAPEVTNQNAFAEQ